MNEVREILESLAELSPAPESTSDPEALAEQAERFVGARAGLLVMLEGLNPTALDSECSRLLEKILDADRRWSAVLMAAKEQARARTSAASRAARYQIDAPDSLGGKREA